ncbi:MAG: BlaI/MecI/CopY family transcriptional regulator [Blastopirellula sp. JB062]
MARPKAKQLTERELEIMHIFWKRQECGVAEVQADLEEQGRPLAYTTVSTLVKILLEKGFLKQVAHDRPYRFRAVRSFGEVSGRMLTDLIQQVFGGSREALLTRLIDPEKLSENERKLVESLLEQADDSPGKKGKRK